MTDEHQKNLRKIEELFWNKIDSWEYHSEWFDSYVYTINNEWIFKIPRRNDNTWKELQREKIFLDKFGNNLPINIPKIEYMGDKVLGYKKILWTHLTEEFFDNLNEDKRQKIARDLWMFLKKMHGIILDNKTPNKYRCFFHKEWFLDLVKKVKKYIFPEIEEKVQENIKNFLNEFKNNNDNFKNQRWTVHADIFYFNMLWDDLNDRLWIIDFWDIWIDSFVKDFTLLADFTNSRNDKFLKDILNVYNSPDLDLFRKVKVFSKLEKLYCPVENVEYSETGSEKNETFYKNIDIVKEVFK